MDGQAPSTLKPTKPRTTTVRSNRPDGPGNDAAQDFRRLSDQYPDVGTNCSLYKFKGRRQRETPVTDVRGIVEIIMLLQSHQATRVRRHAAELLVRYLGGDLAILDEVCALRGLQE